MPALEFPVIPVKMILLPVVQAKMVIMTMIMMIMMMVGMMINVMTNVVKVMIWSRDAYNDHDHGGDKRNNTIKLVL